MTTVLRITERLLAAVLGADRAGTEIGDLEEEIIRRREAGRRLLWLWAPWQVGRLFVAAAIAGIPRLGRQWRQVVRDAVRGLRAAPTTMLLALGVLTLAMTAATVTFSVVDHVVLRRLPFPGDDRLITIYGNTPRGRSWIVAPQDYFAWREGVPAIEHLAAWSGVGEVTIGSGDDTARVGLITCTASLFDVLRVRPALGRPFGGEHEAIGAPKVVVLGHGLWQRRFGGDPAVLGRSITIASVAHEIIGVMPPGAEFPVGGLPPTELWRPYVPRADERAYATTSGRSSYLRITGRLRDGASLDQAADQVGTVIATLKAQHAGLFQGWQVQVAFLRDALVGDVRGWMLLVLGSVVLVLLVACVNVANLRLVRSTARSREFAVRASLGATRSQLLLTLIAESVVLSVIACGAAVLAAGWSIDLVKSALPEGLSRASLISLDWRVIGAAFAAALGTGVVFGAIPAWQASRANIVAILKAGSPPGTGRDRRRWQGGLLIAQIGLVVMLLFATSLLVTSFVRIMRADLGFTRQNLIGVAVSLSWPGVPAAERSARSREFLRQTKGVLERLPGIARVAYLAGAELPLFGSSAGTSISLPEANEQSAALNVEFRRASEGYFSATGMRVLEGRTFLESDRDQKLVVLDETAALRLFGRRQIVGANVRVLHDKTPSTVIGVVSSVRFQGPEGEQMPQLYLPWSLEGAQGGAPMIVVRTSAPAADVVPAIKAALAELMPAGSRPPTITIVDHLYWRLTADRRFNAGLMSLFGALALLIGAAGIYSVMASTVAQRTREIGIRCALGATRPRIARVVLSEAARQVSIGVGIGLSAAWAISGYFSSLLFGVRPTEPALFAIVIAILAMTGLLAAWVPARRASRVDPVIALRE